MDPVALLDLTHRMLVVVLYVSLPIVAVALIAGLVIGALQAVTQIQDPSIAHGARLLAVAATIAVFAAWGGGELLRFARHVFQMLESIR